jgi:predicted AAA+ superfamily ATPase
MNFKRTLDCSAFKTSSFLLGPRMTGKTTLLRTLKVDDYCDLLDPALELELRARPRLFWERTGALGKNALIVIDEIQKVPELLNYVQMGIDQLDQQFILSGSSARKLRRGGANMLGGRALERTLHPLTMDEINGARTIEDVLRYGSLPKICSLLADLEPGLATAHLKSYANVYLKEEIQAEALTRNIGSFQRFFSIAAQSNGQVIEFANISREASVPASTVKEYYQILEDTLIGFYLWPFNRNERRKSRPKFYFFDCGVVRAIQNRLVDPPTKEETGFLFETWMINELRRIRDYTGKPHEFSFWRERKHEVDVVVSGNGGPFLAVECKSGVVDIARETAGLFSARFPEAQLVVASLNDVKPRVVHGIRVLPYHEVIELYKGT